MGLRNADKMEGAARPSAEGPEGHEGLVEGRVSGVACWLGTQCTEVGGRTRGKGQGPDLGRPHK